MPAVLTTAASITCPHAPGRVPPPAPAQTVLFIMGEPVITAAGLASMVIVGCADSSRKPPTPCTKVVRLPQSKKLFIQGSPALLAGSGKALKPPLPFPPGASLRAEDTASHVFA
ncbi:hypothetical protein AB0K09_18980 [Streptomyces sp. NPDC049577]|uniref:hypothetical protein n=1 Tax=Streptomyces sp. NPDC049577 TaxID=3155153 RepID=UPI0034293346